MLDVEKLSIYFPYKLQCMVDGKIAVLEGIYSDGSCVFHDLVESEVGFDSIKPILKPLTVSELINIWEENHNTDADVRSFMAEHFLEEKGFENIEQLIDYNPEWWPLGTLKLFAKYHIDIYGLISKGLAFNQYKFTDLLIHTSIPSTSSTSTSVCP